MTCSPSAHESLLDIDGHAYKPAHTVLLREQNHGACLVCLQLYSCHHFSSLPDALGKYCHDLASLSSQCGMSQCPLKSQLHDSEY